MTRPSQTRARPPAALLALTLAVLTACTQTPSSTPDPQAPAALDGPAVVEDHDEHLHTPGADPDPALGPDAASAQTTRPLLACPPIGPKTSHVKGTLRVLLLPNDFPDRPRSEDVTVNPNDLTAVRNFVRRETLCQADLEFIIPPKRLHLPKASEGYHYYSQMFDAIQLARNQGFTETYDRYWLMHPRIGATGMASLGGSYIWIGSFNWYAFHELGHTFGLHHARTFGIETFTSPAKIQLGYLTPAAPSATGGYTYVRARANGTFTLYAENVLGPGPGGHRALVVPDPTLPPVARTLQYDASKPSLVGPNDHVLSVRSEGGNPPRLYLHENGNISGDGGCRLTNDKSALYCSPKPTVRLDPRRDTADTKDFYLLEGQTYRNDELGYSVRVLRAVPATATTPAGLEVQLTLDRDPDTQAVRPLSDAPFVSATNGLGPVERNATNGAAAAGDGKPLFLGGKIFAKGLGVSAPSDVVFNLAPFGNKCTTFRAEIGPDYASRGYDSVAMQVYGQKAGQSDWTLLYDTGVPKGPGTAGRLIPADIGASVKGYAKVRLTVTDGGNGNKNDTVIWANPRLVCDAGAPNPFPAASSANGGPRSN